jgi:hypothetical protein
MKIEQRAAKNVSIEVESLSNSSFWAIICREAIRRKLSIACGLKGSTIKPKYDEYYACDCEYCKFENHHFVFSEV